MAPPPDLYDQDSAEPGPQGGVQIPAHGTGRRRTRDGAPQLASGRGRHPRSGRSHKANPVARVGRGVRTSWRGNIGWVLPLVVLVGSVLGLYLVATDRLNSDDDATPDSSTPEGLAVSAGGGPMALIVQVDEGGAALGFTLFALDGGDGGTAVLLPASTMVEIPGFGLDRLARAVELGGVPLAELSLRNLLSVELTHVSVLGPDDWEAMTGTLGSIAIDNPGRLDRADDTGRIEVLWPAGEVTVAAQEVADFLAGRAIDETDLERLVRHQRFWISYLEARQGIVGVVDDPTRDLDTFLDEAAARAGQLDYRIMPVELLGGPDELYGVDTEGLGELLAVLSPTTGSEGSGRIRVQLLNGVGTPGLAEPVTNLLLPTGAMVQLTGNALSFDHDTTQIVYYHDADIEAALQIRDELGLGEVVKQREALDVVDITVVIGRDLAAAVTG